MLLAALLLLAPRAVAQAAPDGVERVAAPADPRATLDEAVALYGEGATAQARQRILELLAWGPDLPAAVRQDALAWLGDILLAEQGEAAARNAFEALLAEAPDYQFDRLRHAEAVVTAFEGVRADLRARAASALVTPPLPPPPPADPWPWLCVVPGGAVYYPDGRVGLGIAFGAAQAAGLGVSVATRLRMQSIQERMLDPDEPVRVDAPEAERQRWQATYDRLFVANVAATLVGWGAYVTPVVWETSRWGGGRSAQVAVGPGAVRVSGSF